MTTWTYPKDEAEWLALRKRYVTASEAPVLAGVSTYTSPFELWQVKAGNIEPRPFDADANFWGHADEAALAKWFTLKTGKTLEDPGDYAVATNDRYPHLSATLDRIDEDGCPVELKLREWARLPEGREMVDYSEEDDSEVIPLPVYCQLQVQMAMVEAPHGHAVIRTGLKCARLYRVDFSELFVASLSKAATRFIKSIATGTPPAVDGHDATTDALKRLYPTVERPSVVLPPEAAEWDEELRALKRSVSESGKRIAELENRMREAIGNAEIGIGPGFEYTYSTVSHKEYTVKASEYRKLNRRGKRA